jgi:hypothetical protein
MPAEEGKIWVRLAHTHGIYKEQGVDGAEVYDIHVTGFDPEDGQIIRSEDGRVLTPIHEVKRTDGVYAAIGEKRLIEVRTDREYTAIHEAVEASRARRTEQRAATAFALQTDQAATQPATDEEATATKEAAKADAVAKVEAASK